MTSPRIPLWSADDPQTPPDIRDALDYARQRYGGNPNVMRVLSNHPEIARRYIDLSKIPYGEASSLTPIDRELAYTTTTMVNQCLY